MDVGDLVRKYIDENSMMQVATVNNGKPWICTVYYVQDDNLNLYWISLPSRRHSQEILNNQDVAVAIPVKYTPGSKVVGLQIEGSARLVEDPEEIKSAMRLYANKFSNDQWYKDYLAGKNPHKPYCIKPTQIVLFDEESFSDDPRKEWKP